jgi:hypothetical protein
MPIPPNPAPITMTRYDDGSGIGPPRALRGDRPRVFRAA